MTASPSSASERGPFSGLLAAQIFFIGTTPFVEGTGLGRIFLILGIFGVMAAGALVSTARRGVLVVSIAFFVVTAAIWLGPDLLPDPIHRVVSYGIVGLGYAYTAGIVVATVAQHERVTTDTILGGINAYLLIATAFMMFHATVLWIEPGAYLIGGEPMAGWLQAQPSSHGLATLFYFSFTTITTLGYGDIVPAGDAARLLTSAEAILGQLFVAIFIARLVSLAASQRVTSR